MNVNRRDELTCLGIFPLKDKKQLEGTVTPILQLRTKFLVPSERFYEALLLNKDIVNEEESKKLKLYLERFSPQLALFVRKEHPEEGIDSFIFRTEKYEFEVYYFKSDCSLKFNGIYDVDEKQKQKQRQDAIQGMITNHQAEKNTISPTRLEEKAYWDRYDVDQPLENEIDSGSHALPEQRRNPKYDRLGLDSLIVEQTSSLWKVCRHNGMSIDEFLHFIRIGLEPFPRNSNHALSFFGR
ncbi:Schizosaccharomyces specific protein Mug35 [Schizosaccharomyces osmophilus]|uniref:Schizosaccharomyces specific protein Mug35 n=1 Tax=Schizosaccharomyces osmophilus TaxID=2545709 RepID=A0AAF0AV51_9SCHI|nr:Schizosaccharomyces specific protein Mug35 [Schizosaccharomyces osmophilus]WBW72227.1 Schizosaccharomyces specific protein Mug35 [Schizosaccharomyces osmophilus]